jgi:hypothetical protein
VLLGGKDKMGIGIIVLGMHRGGTSLTANLLHKYGIYGGDKESLMKGNAGNPHGYFEYLPLVDFNTELLFSIDATWHIPPTEKKCEELENKSSDSPYKDKALHLVHTMQEDSRVWFWKDPRLAVLLPFWKNLWGDAIYIIPIRHPLDIALSLRKRNNFPISASLLIWQLYMGAILKGTEIHHNRLFIEYEELVENPVEQCERLYLFLSRFYKTEASKQQVIKDMVQTIDPKLRRNRNDSISLDVPQATKEQKALYDFLRRKINNPIERSDQSIFTVYSGWREYLLTLDTTLHVWDQLPPKAKGVIHSRLTSLHKELFGL